MIPIKNKKTLLAVEGGEGSKEGYITHIGAWVIIVIIDIFYRKFI